MAVTDFLKHAWNAFMNKDPTKKKDYGTSFYRRPDRNRILLGNERSTMASVFNRIAMDCAQIEIRHVLIDDQKRYSEDCEDELNNCLTLEANLDQTARAFRQDIVMSMLDEGCVAIVPTDTEEDITEKEGLSIKILEIRTGKIVEWFPENVKINVYNEKKAERQDVILPKRNVCIIENPLYSVVNEYNSTAKRLIRKLALLDAVDNQLSSGKLDMIIQLPYSIRGEVQRARAEERRRDIEEQLTNTKYGIAYIDAAEKITQLNRPLENNLLNQVDYLTKMLFSQLGITQEILDGSANEETMQNYYSRTIEPIMSAICDEIKRKFLSKTARTRNHSIMFFRDPFQLMPVSKVADMGDKLIRNTILTPNEFRQILGRKPSQDENADKLMNPNISQPGEEMVEEEVEEFPEEELPAEELPEEELPEEELPEEPI